jgi:hypothetical protein
MNFPDELINRIIRYPGAVAMRLRIMRLRLLGASYWPEMLDPADRGAEEPVGHRDR